MNIDSATAVISPPDAAAPRNSSQLDGDDFLRLLIAQITNQDPLEPVSNQDMLNQMSAIREIEVSTSLASALTQLTQQQRFGSAASLIGRHVTSVPNGQGQSDSGLVTGVRFEPDGGAVLRLESGVEVPLDKVQSVETALHAAEGLIGRMVFGVDRTSLETVREISGLVASVRADDRGEVYLELDTGEKLRFRDVLRVGEAA